MVRLFTTLILCYVFAFAANAQDEQLPPSSNPQADQWQLPNTEALPARKKIDFKDFTVEPNIILSVFQYGITAGAAPYVGHRLKGNLFGGAGITYIHTGFRNIGFTDGLGGQHFTNAQWQTFGGGVFLQYNIWRGLFVRTRFEVLHRIGDDVFSATVKTNYQANTADIIMPKIRKTIPALPVGVGYNLLEIKNFFFPLTVSYDILHSATDKQFAIYPNGWMVELGFISVF